MNKSVSKSLFSTNQINQTKTTITNNLSETSSDFLSQIKLNINNNFTNIKGGACPCSESLVAFNNKNYELALYILNKSTYCATCQDDNGNTILHHLVMYCSECNNNSTCIGALNGLLSRKDISNFIDIQNTDGTTAILLAVINNNELIANKLDQAGANKMIEDNIGNFLGTDVEKDVYTEKNNETPNEQICINNVVKLVLHDKDNDNDKTSFNFNLNNDIVSPQRENSDLLLKKLNKFISNKKENLLIDKKSSTSDDFLSTDKFINFLSNKYKKQPPKTIDELFNQNNKPTNSIIVDDKSTDTDDLPVILNTETNKLLNETTSDNLNTNTNSNTEYFINNLSKKVFNKINNKKSLLKSDSYNNENINNESVDTDILMKTLENLQQKQNNSKIFKGGANKNTKSNQTIMGYRHLMLHSEKSLMSDVLDTEKLNKLTHSNQKSSGHKSSNNLDKISNQNLYYSDSEMGASTNELSRLIQSRKSELHNEVTNMIMGMLNKGIISQDSKPIEATEKNAKLIKAYLYRIISEKNPQLTGMDKILMIKKMNDNEIIDILKKMPNLDELEQIIQKHLEEKYKNNNQDKKLDKKLDNKNKKVKKVKKVNNKDEVELSTLNNLISTSDTDTDTDSDTKLKKTKKTSKK